MKILLNWVKEFVDIPISVSELAHRLTLAGLEVESILELGNIPDSIKVVKILKMEKHPQADRLTVCQVSLGDEKLLQIVCGAKNMKEGDYVPLALPGTVLPDGKVIGSSELRGVKSDGMLCSEQELNLLEESSGLFILPQDLKLGQSLAQALPLKDTLLEINVTPNRADCLSIYGIAQEISALLNLPLKPLEVFNPTTVDSQTNLQIHVEDLKSCSSYFSWVLKGVEIKPASWWVRLRLMQMGLRSINHVVDASNYVMLEYGQPLHAFDLKKIKGNTLFVKQLKETQNFVGLDEQNRSLVAGDLVIADSDQTLALAGVMGAKDSAVDDNTRALLLESAHFDAGLVRKTSKRLGLQTESSYRFERGVDPLGQKKALLRMAQLLNAKGVVFEKLLEKEVSPYKAKPIKLRLMKLKQVLGFDLSSDEVLKILKSLQMDVKVHDAYFEVIPSSYRVDILREIDLIEEVARLYGYEKIPEHLPKGTFKLAKDYSSFFKEHELKQFLKHFGFVETIHYSFCSPKLLSSFISQDKNLMLANPLSEEMSQLRNLLLPQLLENLSHNFSQIREDQKIFELRSVFKKEDSILEEKHLGMAMLGRVSPVQWALEDRPSDFYDLKGVLENLCAELGLPSFECQASHDSFLHPGLSVNLLFQGKSYGFLGALHPKLIKNFNFSDQAVWVAEINLSKLFTLKLEKQKIKSPSKFPPITRDVTLWAPESFEAGKILEAINNQSSLLLKQLQLKYVYRGEPVEIGKKALTFTLCYQSDEKTLTDQEVNENHENLIRTLLDQFPLQWR